MKKILIQSCFLMLGCAAIISCDSDDNSNYRAVKDNLYVDLKGLEDLGPNYVYEGWLMVNGNPVSTGTFTVDSNGKMSKDLFNVGSDNLSAATAYVLSIEPSNDTDPNPSNVKVLAGDFSGFSATLSTKHGAALGTDFSSATGTYILATPTDTDSTNELSGVWWLDNTNNPSTPGLNLPTLPSGWEYEGWAVIDGKPVSTGKFTAVNVADSGNPFSGTAATPPFPGEDFLMNAPMGLTFPTNLQDKKVVISVEPKPDNSPKPFSMKPLVGDVPANAMDHTAYQMANKASKNNPSGSVHR